MENNKISKLKSIGEILLIILVFFLLVSIVEAIVMIVYFFYLSHTSSMAIATEDIMKISKSTNIGFINYALIVQNIITILIVLLFTKGKLKEKFIKIRLIISSKDMKLFSIGILCGLAEIIFITFLGIITGITNFQFFGSTTFLNWIYIFILSLITFLFVGFGEEILFRGYVFNKLLESGNKIWAIGLSAIIFMLFHIGTYSKPLDFMDVFLAGIFLAFLYDTSKSLWLSIGFHFMWDFTQSFFITIEEQNIKATSILNFSIPNNVHAFGIDFGCKFEVVFIIVEFIFIGIMIYIRYMKKNKISSN